MMVPKWIFSLEAAMAVTLSIKNVPDRLAGQLRRRAARNHRSVQGELLAILEQSLAEDRWLTPEELLFKVRQVGLRRAASTARMIRKDRDARSRR